MNPGDTPTSLARRSRAPTLNEGRGVNPGDTLAQPFVSILAVERSTKAGA